MKVLDWLALVCMLWTATAFPIVIIGSLAGMLSPNVFGVVICLPVTLALTCVWWRIAGKAWENR